MFEFGNIVSTVNEQVKKTRHCIFVRFSHVSTKYNPFRSARDVSFEDYCNNIFNEERLEKRFYLFEKYCLPSFDAQTDKDFILNLRCSTLMPAKWIERLVELAGSRNYVFLNFLAPDAPILEKELSALDYLLEDKAGPIITSRIDDDDGLSKYFVEKAKLYMLPSLRGYALSYSTGHYIKESRSEGHVHYKVPDVRHVNNSCGLSLISGRMNFKKFIMNTGVNHLHIDKSIPVIVDGRDKMILMSAHSEQDTNRAGHMKFDGQDWLSGDVAIARLGESYSWAVL